MAVLRTAFGLDYSRMVKSLFHLHDFFYQQCVGGELILQDFQGTTEEARGITLPSQIVMSSFKLK